MQCRVCQSFHCEDAMDMSHVLPIVGKSLYDCFNECTQLKATNKDGLPKILCMNCTRSLQQAYNFRQEARRSDEELKKILAFAKCEEFISDPTPNQSEVLEDFEGITNQLLPVSLQRDTAFVYYPERSSALDRTELCDLPPVPSKTKSSVDDSIEESVPLKNNHGTSTIDHLYAPLHSEQAESNLFSIVNKEEHEFNIVKEEINTEPFNDILEDSSRCIFEEPKHHEKVNPGDTLESKHRQTYNCELCAYKCATKNKLKIHIFKIHKETIICQKCCKVFEVPAEMEMHRKLVHATDTEMCCPWCKNSNYLPKDQLAKHLQKKHNGVYFKYFPRLRMLERGEDDPYQCERCQKMFSSIEELANHVQGHKFHCPLCSMTFKKTGTYRLHVKRIHKQSLTSLKAMLIDNDEHNMAYKCKLCEKQLKSKETFRRHMKSKHKESMLNDNKCNTAKFARDEASEKKTHVVYKENSETMPEMEKVSEKDGDELVKCKHCHREIPARRIVEHEKRHAYRLNQERKSICSFCSREFKSVSSVKNHERKMHLCDKRERKECPVCHKQIDARNFNAHITYVHNKERNFACDICGDLFKTSTQLSNHKQLHLNRKYTCTICNKGFIRQVDLKVHIRIHTGEEPFVCHICERRFRYKVQLNYHLQRHAGIKRKCNVCGKEFNHIKHLRNHSYKHTGMPYRCTVCKYACAQRGVFRAHILRMHNMTMTDVEYRAMFKANTGRNPCVKTLDELQLESKNMEIE